MKKTLLILGLLVLLSAVPVEAVDYGGQPELDNSWKPLPVCTENKPKAPILYEPNNPAIQKAKNPGEIRLQWTKVPQASNYNVYFGLSPRNYIYSATDIGNVDNYTVRFLGNRTYYFAVQSKANCAIGPVSNEWAARPGGGGTAIVPRSFVPVQKTTIVEDQLEPQAPQLVPSAPVAPAPKAKAVAPVVKPQGFFQSIGSFFGKLFGGK